jgi:hypothetical protein
LPPDLDPSFRRFLFRHIEHTIAPRDDHEHWLAARIATAMSRLHVNATREPEAPSPAWLRYEALADRQLRAAHRDLKAHRATQPPTGDPPATSRDDIPQTQPNPRNPTFAPPRTPMPPAPHLTDRLLDEMERLLNISEVPVGPAPT